MTLLIGICVIGAGALHATWNAIAKHVDDRLVTFALIGVPMLAGGAVALVVGGLPARSAVPFAVLSAGLHIGYDLALMSSYRLGALNQVYPIARGVSPLVVTVGAYGFAGERLSAVELAGIAVLATGLVSLARSSRADLRSVLAAVVTGLAIASYSVVDGLGVRRAHDAVAYGGLLFVLMGPVFPAVAAVRRPASTWRAPVVVGRGLAAGALSVLAYGIVLWAQTRAPLAVVASLRETSVIFAAVIGALFLHERFGARRVAAAVLVAGGVALISS